MAPELIPDLAIAVSEILPNVALHGGQDDALTIEIAVGDDEGFVVPLTADHVEAVRRTTHGSIRGLTSRSRAA